MRNIVIQTDLDLVTVKDIRMEKGERFLEVAFTVATDRGSFEASEVVAGEDQQLFLANPDLPSVSREALEKIIRGCPFATSGRIAEVLGAFLMR